MRTRLTPILVATLALAAITACAPAAPPAPAGQAPAQKPAESAPSVLRFATPTFGEGTLDPTLTSITSSLGLVGPLWDWLTEVDAQGKLGPGLAESWKPADDGLSWEFKLRPGVKFHNGAELTAEDVRFSLTEAFIRQGAQNSRADQFRKDLKGVEVLDKLTFRVTTNVRWPTLALDLANQPGIEGVVLPGAYIKQVGWEAFAKQPVGSGPYKFVRYQPGNVIEFEAVKDHWRAKPQFDRLQILLVPEVTTRIAMLRSGEADVATVTLDTLPEVEAAGLKVTGDPDRASVRIHLHGIYYPNPGPVGNIKVRQALNLSVNRDEMVKTIFRGRAAPAAIYPAGKITLGYPADLKAYPYDPDQAKKLLAEAGQPNGFTIKMYCLSTGGFAQYQQVCEAVAGYWDRIGVKTTIVPTDLGAVRPMYVAQPQAPDLVGAAMIFATGPRLNGLDDVRINFTVGAKVSQLAQVDDDVKQAGNARTVEEIGKVTQDIYRKLYNDYVGIPIADVDGVLWAYGKRVSDIKLRPHRGYIEPSLAAAVKAS